MEKYPKLLRKRKSHLSGAQILIIRTAKDAFVILCETHKTSMQVSNFKEAAGFAVQPGYFCNECTKLGLERKKARMEAEKKYFERRK